MSDYTIYHNPSCGTSRNVLALLRHAGVEPEVVEYLQTPPSEARLRELLDAMGMTPRQLLREKGTFYAELGLGDDRWTDRDLIAHILAHPILMNRPIVVSPRGTKLCRPSDEALELLPEGIMPPFTKSDGEVLTDDGRRRPLL